MRLGELISLLERMPQDMVVAKGFGSPQFETLKELFSTAVWAVTT